MRAHRLLLPEARRDGEGNGSTGCDRIGIVSLARMAASKPQGISISMKHADGRLVGMRESSQTAVAMFI